MEGFSKMAKQLPKERSAAIAVLYELFPTSLEFKPLTLGTGKVLKPVYMATGNSGMDYKRAMQAHILSRRYQKACAEAGAPRYMANGKIKGEVAEEQAYFVRKRLGWAK